MAIYEEVVITYILCLAERRLLPQTAVVKRGQSTQFTCQSHEDVSWKFNNIALTQVKGVKMKKQKKNKYVLNIQVTRDGIISCIGYEWGVQFLEIAKVDLS